MKKTFLIVGAGLYGAVCARELTDAGYQVTVIEKRDHLRVTAIASMTSKQVVISIFMA